MMRNIKRHSAFGLSEIGPCILRRSEDCLTRYLEENKSAPSSYGDQVCDPTCLAVGWTSGLEILLKAGFGAWKALELAILTENIASIVSILPYTTFFDNTPEGRPRNRLFSFLQNRVKQKADVVNLIVVEFESRQHEHDGNEGEI
jgi:hypothetical protein